MRKNKRLKAHGNRETRTEMLVAHEVLSENYILWESAKDTRCAKAVGKELVKRHQHH